MIVVDKDDIVLLIVDGLGVGLVGNWVYLDCCLIFMVLDFIIFEVLVFVEVEDGEVVDIYMLFFVMLVFDMDYWLVGVDKDSVILKFGEMVCVFFVCGMYIILVIGEQVKIEDLCVGDKVLICDDGFQ